MLKKTLPFTTGEIQVVGVALAIKTVITLAMVVFFYAFSDFDNVFNPWNRWYTGQDDLSSWYIPFANWDGQNYLLLADWGYGHGKQYKVFYPLYPGLIHLLSYVFSPGASAVLLSYAFTAGFCFFLYRLAVHFGCAKAHVTVLLVVTFPTAFFFSAFYTESLFLFLQMGFLYHLFVTRSKARLVYLTLLPLTRGTAAFVFGGLVLYTAFEYAVHRVNRSKRRKPRPPSTPRSSRKRHPKTDQKAIALQAFDWWYHLNGYLAFFAGAVAYLLVMTLMTGDPFSGITAQDTIVSKNRVGNLFNPVIFLQNLFSNTEAWFSYTRSMHDRIFMVLFLACSAFFVAYREWRLLCFYFPTMYAHMAMGVGAMSYSRYILAVVPFLALVLVKNTRRSWPLYAVCAAGFIGQVYLVYRFSLNLWVG